MPVLTISGATVTRRAARARGTSSNHLRDKSRQKRSDGNRRRRIRDSVQRDHQLQLFSGTPSPVQTRTWKLYVLRLEGGNYYVGITSLSDIAMRFRRHASGKGAKWTRIHQPLEIIESIDLGKISQREAEKIETARTLDYIKKFGVANVRGGSLCLVNNLAHEKQHVSISAQHKDNEKHSVWMTAASIDS